MKNYHFKSQGDEKYTEPVGVCDGVHSVVRERERRCVHLSVHKRARVCVCVLASVYVCV